VILYYQAREAGEDEDESLDSSPTDFWENLIPELQRRVKMRTWFSSPTPSSGIIATVNIVFFLKILSTPKGAPPAGQERAF